MMHEYIAKMYKNGQNTEARRAIKQEIARENTPEGENPAYRPTTEEIDAVEAEYYASRRAYRYGPPEKQTEYIAENGISAWQQLVSQVKADIPKPVE